MTSPLERIKLLYQVQVCSSGPPWISPACKHKKVGVWKSNAACNSSKAFMVFRRLLKHQIHQRPSSTAAFCRQQIKYTGMVMRPLPSLEHPAEYAVLYHFHWEFVRCHMVVISFQLLPAAAERKE